MHGDWMMQKLIKSCVWHDLFKANFVSHTFSMWLETHRHLFPKIKWLIARTRSTAISILSELNYVSFSLSLTLCLCTKIFFFRRKFVFRKQFLWMRSYEYIYIYIYTHTLVNKHIWKKKIVHKLTNSKKKKKLDKGHNPHMPKPNPMSSPWAYKLICYFFPIFCRTQWFSPL